MTTTALLAKPPAPAASEPRIAAERPSDAARVEALIAEAFGPGRFAKTAERLREGASAPRIALTAWIDGDLAGAVRLWPVTVGAAPALFLGPIAVSARRRRHGLGARLVECACVLAAEDGAPLVLLVGDRPFFEPLGFHPVAPGRVVLPGPVNPARILWRELRPGASEGAAGAVAPAP